MVLFDTIKKKKTEKSRLIREDFFFSNFLAHENQLIGVYLINTIIINWIQAQFTLHKFYDIIETFTVEKKIVT